MWAVCVYDYDLSSDEAWETDLFEMAVLRKRQKAKIERDDYRAGIIAATIANSFRGKKDKALQPEDFIPKEKEKEQTWQEQLQWVEMLNTAFGGKDKRKRAN